MGIFAAGLWTKSSSGAPLYVDIFLTFQQDPKIQMPQNGIGGTCGFADIHQNMQPAGGGDANASSGGGGGGDGGGSAPSGGGGSLGGGGGGNDAAQQNNQAARIQAAAAQASAPRGR